MPSRSSRGCDTKDRVRGGRIDSGVASVIIHRPLERHDDASVTRRSHARLRLSITTSVLAPLNAWFKASHIVSVVAWMAGMRNAFHEDCNTRSPRFYRVVSGTIGSRGDHRHDHRRAVLITTERGLATRRPLDDDPRGVPLLAGIGGNATRRVRAWRQAPLPDTPSSRSDRRAIESETRHHKISGATAIVRAGAAAPAGPMNLIDQLTAGLPSFHDQAAAVAVHRAGIEHT